MMKKARRGESERNVCERRGANERLGGKRRGE